MASDIPKNLIDTTLNLDTPTSELSTSNTYLIDFKNKVIAGMCNNLEAVNQSINILLNIEQYKYGIYRADYGVDFSNVFSNDIETVVSEIYSKVSDALLYDKRIVGVTLSKYNETEDSVSLDLEIETIFGIVNTSVGVKI